MSQFRLQNYIFVPEFQFTISRQKPKYSIRRYEESFENNSIKHVCTVKKIFKNSQTDAILPKSRVRKNAIEEQNFKKVRNVQDTKRRISHSIMTLAVSASHLLLMKKVYLATLS